MRKPLIALLTLALLAPLARAADAPATTPTTTAPATQESAEQKDARMKWWRDARFGLFIHWGIYSVPAGQWQGKPVRGIGEWIMKHGKIPVADYAKFAEQFNPTKYDADAWVKAAKDAGMKYIVITSKHHDGFAMFDSKATDYDIVDRTPYKKDVLKPLAEACQRHGIKLGFYYSQAQDWHHPGGAGADWDPAQKGDMDQYIRDVAVPQVREILTNYGPIAILWWDTPQDMNKPRAEALLPLLALQPGIITNNRLGAGYRGDTETPEQHIPATGFPGGRDFEVCMTMNDTWGFKSDDDNWKSAQQLIQQLCETASKGGNYLLNVGPTQQGEIPQPSIERLATIGQWMRANGDAIYGTTASPFRRYSFDGRATVKGNKLFLHVFEWPSDGVKVLGLKTPVKSARFLDGGAPATIAGAPDERGVATLTIQPPTKPDPYATVVELDLDGPPAADPVALAIHPRRTAEYLLLAAEADINGNAQLHEDFVGRWRDVNTTVSWQLNVPQAGEYEVEITYAASRNWAGATYAVTTGESQVTGQTKPAEGFRAFNTEKLGKLALKPGQQTLTVKAVEKPRAEVMNLREIRLTPAAK